MLGENVINNDISDFLHEAKKLRVFKAEIEKDTRVALIFCFAWMGYEIGDEKKVDLFAGDVVRQLYNFDALYETDTTNKFVRNIMISGAFWKQDIDRDTPSEFTDFIKTLKFP
jgi:hypothetical protein